MSLFPPVHLALLPTYHTDEQREFQRNSRKYQKLVEHENTKIGALVLYLKGYKTEGTAIFVFRTAIFFTEKSKLPHFLILGKRVMSLLDITTHQQSQCRRVVRYPSWLRAHWPAAASRKKTGKKSSTAVKRCERSCLTVEIVVWQNNIRLRSTFSFVFVCQTEYGCL